MNKSMLLCWTTVMVLTAATFGRAAEEKFANPDAEKELKDLRDRVGYAYGVSVGNSMKSQGYDVNPEALRRGLEDVTQGKAGLMTTDEARLVLRNYQTEMRAKAEAKRKEAGEKTKLEGEKFLAENKTKPGIKVTASGLQYQVITQGTGPIPSKDDNVSTHYTGTLIDGKVFDSSTKQGRPAEFPVSGVIKGWTEALQLMNVGSKWKLFVPSELAYGDRGAGADILPNATLIFEVELLSIKEKPPVEPGTTQGVVTSDIIKVPSAEEMKAGAKIEVIKSSDAERLAQEARDAAKKAAGTPEKK